MRAMLLVAEPLKDSLTAFAAAEALPFEVVSGQDVPAGVAGGARPRVRVVPGCKGEASTLSELRAGGMITCTLARELAARLGVSPGVIGRLLDQLQIKVRACELGCFE